MLSAKHPSCKVPAALANDNFQGYMHPFIVEHKVRWIEAIAACPFLTTLVTYYVEGHPKERHHVCDEEIGQQQRAYAIRGNVFSYILPWESILASACAVTPAEWLNQWPHAPKIVAHLVKALFVNTGDEHSLKHLKELKIRAHILVGLGKIYIEHGQEDMCKQPNALANYTARVSTLYPTDRFGGDGGLIEEIEAISRACSKNIQSNNAETPFEMKNAAMPDHQKDKTLETVFDNIRPQHVVEDSEAGKVISAEMQVKAGIGNFSEWKVRLQNGLEGQSFTAKYMSWFMNTQWIRTV